VNNYINKYIDIWINEGRPDRTTVDIGIKGTDDSLNKSNKLVHKCGKNVKMKSILLLKVFWAS